MSGTNFAANKQRQGFVQSYQRTSCQSCSFVLRIEHSNGGVGMQCGKGGFFVNAMGVCDDYARFTNVPAPAAKAAA